MSTTQPDFLGCGWGFPPSFDSERGGVQMVSGEQDILQSLQILFSTVKTERIMLPGYGSDLSTLVFDSIDQALLLRLRYLLYDAILFYEPRILVQESDIAVEQDRADSGTLLVKLAYTIRQTNTRSNMVFPFYRAEGSNVRSDDVE